VPKAWYPVCLDLAGRRAVIVGGGAVAARKAESLRKYGAEVVVVAPRIAEALERPGIELRRRAYEPHDLDGATLVIAATNDAALNEAVAAECRRQRILVNVADDPELCDFIVPAVVESGSIQLAVSTGGKSPALARKLKTDLEHALGREYAEVNDLLGELRERAKAAPSLPHDRDRKQFFDDLIGQGIIELIRDGRRADAYRIVADACAAAGIEAGPILRAALGAAS
jgi:precorrin-2 dehydrogenase/sirohydrochlorin ferrochelatase